MGLLENPNDSKWGDPSFPHPKSKQSSAFSKWLYKFKYSIIM